MDLSQCTLVGVRILVGSVTNKTIYYSHEKYGAQLFSRVQLLRPHGL